MINLIEYYEKVKSNISSGHSGVRHGTIYSGFYTSHSREDKKQRIAEIDEEIERLRISR